MNDMIIHSIALKNYTTYSVLLLPKLYDSCYQHKADDEHDFNMVLRDHDTRVMSLMIVVHMSI